MRDAKITLKDISVLTCKIYMFFSIIINILCWVALEGLLPTLFFAFLIFFVSFLISIIKVLICKPTTAKHKKLAKLFSGSAIVYSITSLTLNSFVYIIQSGLLWKISSIMLLVVFSLSVSACKVWFKPTKYIYGAILYFFLIGSFYYLITISIGGYGKGNRYIILLGSYIIIYAVCAVIYYLIKRSIEKNRQNKLPYKNQF